VSPAAGASAAAGTRRRLPTPSPTAAGALVLGSLAALVLAVDAGVSGPGAAPDVARALAAGIVVFGLCGYAPARLLLPASLLPWRALFVLPLGAMASGLALTLLGFAAVPFAAALVLTLTVGALSSLAAARRTRGEPHALPHAAAVPAVAVVAALVVAVALVPTFRSGFATVTGFGSDAHQVAGSAEALRHIYPSSADQSLPVDRVQLPWRSKFPIFYALAAVATVAGLETYEALMSVAALVLALAGLGFFLVARGLFGVGAWAATAALAIAVLDSRVFHLALHPYYNQLWGLLTLPFTLVLAHAWVEDRAVRTLALLGAVTAVGAFAYPLMLPFPLLALAGFLLLDRRERRARGEAVEGIDPRRLWRGRRSLLWMVPLAAVLAVPLRGVVEKVAGALRLVTEPSQGLANWQGDLLFYPPLREFFAVPDMPLDIVLVLGVLALAVLGLRAAPREVGVSLGAMLAAALACAALFRAVDYGQYFFFKVLSFAGPILLVAAVAGAASLERRARAAGLGVAAVTALCALAVLSAREEVSASFDQLWPEMVELRDWSAELPPQESIRLDLRPNEQLWTAYMLAEHPLGSRTPIMEYPHVVYSDSADLALTRSGEPRPFDAAEEAPVLENRQFRLWRLRPLRGGRDTTSREQVPYIREIGLLGG